MKLVSIVLSFKNEEKNINEIVSLIDNVFKNLSNYNYEILFINDLSTDKSEEVIKKLQLNYNIILINMSRNFGGAACTMAGFEHSNGDVIIYMDTDLQDPPELIHELLKNYENGFEVVHTKRKKRLGEPAIKLFFTKIAYRFINFISEINLPKDTGDFKLISRKVLNHILEMKEKDPYIRGLPIWVGFNQKYVEYDRQPRAHGETKYNFFSLNPYMEIIRAITSFSAKPLYLGVIMGLITILLSIILIFYSFLIKLLNTSATGVPSILIAISFFSGVILLKLGIISIYLKKIFEQTKGRKEYIIKDIIYPKDLK